MHPDLAIEPAIDPYGKDGLPLYHMGQIKAPLPYRKTIQPRDGKARVLRASIRFHHKGH